MAVGKLTLSVIICAYNEQDWIGKTLNSLLQQKRLPDEIIVVNNASTDNTEGVVRQIIAEHPELPIKIVLQPRKGLHHARETGWRAARSDIIVITDADILFPPEWLQQYETAFADPSVDAITGILRYNDAPAIINWMTWISDQLYQPEGIGRLMTKEYVLTGGNSAYRRTMLEAVDGYLNKPPDMLEDRHMSHKIQSAGYKVIFARQIKVWHTYRRFQKEGLRGFLKYTVFYSAENVYPDHLSDV